MAYYLSEVIEGFLTKGRCSFHNSLPGTWLRFSACYLVNATRQILYNKVIPVGSLLWLHQPHRDYLRAARVRVIFNFLFKARMDMSHSLVEEFNLI